MVPLETQTTPRQTIHCLIPVNVVVLEPAASKVDAITSQCVQPSGAPVSFASTTQVWMDIPVPPAMNTVSPSCNN